MEIGRCGVRTEVPFGHVCPRTKGTLNFINFIERFRKVLICRHHGERAPDRSIDNPEEVCYAHCQLALKGEYSDQLPFFDRAIHLGVVYLIPEVSLIQIVGQWVDLVWNEFNLAPQGERKYPIPQ